MVSSSKSIIRPQDASSIHLSTSVLSLSFGQCSESRCNRFSPLREPSRYDCNCESSIPIIGERATQDALCREEGRATSCKSPSKAWTAGLSSNPPSRSAWAGTP